MDESAQELLHYGPFFAQLLENHRYVSCILIADPYGTCHLKVSQPDYTDRVFPKFLVSSASLCAQPISKLPFGGCNFQLNVYRSHLVAQTYDGPLVVILIHKITKLDKAPPSAALAALLDVIKQSPTYLDIRERIFAEVQDYDELA